MGDSRRKVSVILESAVRSRILLVFMLLFSIGSMLFCSLPAVAQQANQGTITGTVSDPQGSVVVNATITITNADTGFTITRTTNGSGVYVTPPLSIGHYSVTCAAPGFKTANQANLMLNVDQRLGANFHLEIGETTETVNVSSAGSILQTEQSSTGQVVSTQMINDTPLNQRNYVFIAQLTAGVTPATSGSARGQGNGDFSANGVSPQQNDFILDGVDNNTSSIDFLNGASYVIKPPPDALAEFKIQTSNYGAELGHSAGAVMNASIKSGTNAFHGDLWEYFRNDALDARSFNAPAGRLPEYRQNQFGATIGGPIIKNHLFFFGDFEANRIVIGNTGIFTMPTVAQRTGDFSDLLNPSLTGGAPPVVLYKPGSGGAAPLAYQGRPNVFDPALINPEAQKLVNLLPQPNFGVSGQTFNNFITNQNEVNNTAQWDGRLDWNVREQDQAFARLSLSNNPFSVKPPFGVLDGGGYGSDGSNRLKSEQLELSETHTFSPSLSNQFNFSFQYGSYIFGIPTANRDVSTPLGLGGVPTAAGGGLPVFLPSGWSNFGTGTGCCLPSIEHQNNSELLDNLTKIAGKHALSMGIQLQLIRPQFYVTGFPRGWYTYTGLFTSNPSISNTGFGGADFLADYQNSNIVSTADSVEQYRWYRAAYFQDDWKLTPKLTLNLGLRWDRYGAFDEKKGRQANEIVTSAGLGTGTANYELANNDAVGPAFAALAAKDHINITRSSNPALTSIQNLNFAPRIGFAYSVDPKTVVRGAFGLFYGGLQNGGGTNIGANYPWSTQTTFISPTCPVGGPCATDGLTLATGFSKYLNQPGGLLNLPISYPVINAIQDPAKTPYTESYNLTVQRAFTSTMTATLGYVGTVGRHLQQSNVWGNAPYALAAPGTDTTPFQPFPDFGRITYTAFVGASNYNSFQATVEKHFGDGLNFLSSYTWSHSLDDNLGSSLWVTPNSSLIPFNNGYGNSDLDVRQRFTLNGVYELPVGSGRRFLSHKGILNELVGGWSIGVMFTTQTGNAFTVTPNNTPPAGLNYEVARMTGDPFKGGGTPNASNPNITCPTKVKTVQNWFNPCAFSNPLPGSNIAPGTLVTSASDAVLYAGHGKNQLHGPGYNRMNNSIFKNFTTYKEQYLQFRADIFNTYNSTAYGLPNGSMNSNGGLITGTTSMGSLSPDGRFIQLALKYYF